MRPKTPSKGKTKQRPKDDGKKKLINFLKNKKKIKEKAMETTTCPFSFLHLFPCVHHPLIISHNKNKFHWPHSLTNWWMPTFLCLADHRPPRRQTRLNKNH